MDTPVAVVVGDSVRELVAEDVAVVVCDCETEVDGEVVAVEVGVVTSAQALNRVVVSMASVVVGVVEGVVVAIAAHTRVPSPMVWACWLGGHSKSLLLRPQYMPWLSAARHA